MLTNAVVVAGDGAASDVHIVPDIRITDIAQMRYFRAILNHCIFNLHKVADLHVIAKLCVRSQICIRTDHTLIANLTIP